METEVTVNKTVITPENYATYQADYADQCAQLEQIPLGVHPMPQPRAPDNPYSKLIPEHMEKEPHRRLAVYAKSPGQISGCWLYGQAVGCGLNYALFYYYQRRRLGHASPKYWEGYEKIVGWFTRMQEAITAQRADKFLAAADAVAHYLAPAFIPAQAAEK